MKRKTVTEAFDVEGNLIERRTEEEEYEDDPTSPAKPWIYPPMYPTPGTVTCPGTDTARGGITWTQNDAYANCPCRVENGGSGVCGCVRFDRIVTC